MIPKKTTLLGVLLVALVLTNCKQENKQQTNDQKTTKEDVTAKNTNVNNMYVLADTITYDVVVKNPNPADTWTEECLQKLNRKALIDNIYKGIYNETLTIYDYYSGEELSTAEVKALENEENFDRNNIGKLQFTEIWYMDQNDLSIHKEVQSAVLGYELKKENGDIKGYKPMFKVVW